MSFDGTYQNVPNGYAYLFRLQPGWKEQPHIYAGTHHEANGTMFQWMGGGDPIFPTGWKDVSRTVIREAVVAVITGDAEDDRYITLGPGDGTSDRWKLTDSLLKKLRREINARLD